MHNQLFILMAAITIIAACDRHESDKQAHKFQATPPIAPGGGRIKHADIYPFERTILDKQGRQLNAIIVGRTNDEIIFQVKDSGTPHKRHRYKLSRLSSQDQAFLKSMPKHEWQGGGGAIVNSLIDERRRIIDKISAINDEKARTPQSHTRIRALDREISKLQKTLTETDDAIKVRRGKDSQGH